MRTYRVCVRVLFECSGSKLLCHGLVIGSRHVLDADRGGQKYFRIMRCVSSRCAGMKPIAKGSPEVFELSEWTTRNSVSLSV